MFLDAMQRSSRVLIALVFTIFLLLRAMPVGPSHVQADHPGGPPHLYMLWDGGTPPTGWSLVSDYDGFFVRGDTVANFGTTTSSGNHTPTVNDITVGPPSGTYYNSGGTGASATAAHIHDDPTITIGAASNNDEPAHRVLKLIRFDDGIPTFIPAGVIAMFDQLPASGWTEYATAHNRFLKLGSTVANAGTDIHTHSLSYSNLINPSASDGRSTFLANQPTSTSTHEHAVANGSTASVTTFPRHVRPLIAKADADTPAIPANLLGFFDEVPGSGWVVRSGSGGDFNERFLRFSSTFDNTGTLGADSHAHSPVVATSGDNTGGNAGNTLNLLGTALATSPHTHDVTTSFNTTENVPDYVNLVVAEKINFILSDYRWFEDSDDEDVTDPWSPIDIPQNSLIPIVPPRSNPVEPGDEIRLRIKLVVSGQDLPPSDVAFVLQYKEDTDAACDVGSWTNLGAGGSGAIWRFASSSVAHGTQLSISHLVPVASVLETYNKENPTTTNASGVTVGFGVEYDFHIENNGAKGATKYSFRIIESTGPPLAEYAICPTLTTKAGTENLLRHGDVFESEVERGFTWAD